MRQLILLLVVVGLLLGTPALAQKSDDHVLRNPVSDSRQGGETIADAVEVPFPFSDAGATCDNVDDYDEVCPYPGSTSPDVVYTFVPASSLEATVDLLGSSYDTKVYLYDEDLQLVACNDDFYPDYVSCIQNLPFVGGQRYYLVIDGYGGDCGEYVVNICENMPCATSCADIDVLEDEPPLVEGYVDTYNAGCDADPPVFQFVEPPVGDDVLWLCGDSGYFGEGLQPEHDTDWFQMVAMGDEVRIDMFAPYGFPVRLDVLFLDDCQNVSLLPYELEVCTDMSNLIVPTAPGQLLTLRVAPLYDFPIGCSGNLDVDQYRLRVEGLAVTVATESRTWSEVKAMHR